MKTGQNYLAYIGNEVIALGTTHTINIKKDNEKKALMEFYYHRGNKYFFRAAFGKMVVEGLEAKLKRGTEYLLEWT